MKNISPLVSVVMPSYNHSDYIKYAIQSIIEQTYKNIELIIIDDGSTDDSMLEINAMVNLCKKRFFRFEVRSRPNMGLSATLNEALEWCEGKYVSPFASDDQMFNDKTATQVRFLEKNVDCVAVFGGVEIVNDKNQTLNTVLGTKKLYGFKQILLHQHDLPAPTAMMRLNKVIEVGMYDPKIKIEDWYMWLKLARTGNLVYLPIIFCKYRSHKGNTSKKIDIMHEERLKIIEVYKNTKHYKIAKKNIFWIRIFELGKDKSLSKRLNRTLFLMKNPDYLLFKILRKFI